MPRLPGLFILCAFLTAIGGICRAAEAPAVVPAPDPAVVARLAAKIDELAEAHWRSAGVKPAEVCDDLTFVRRATLDLAGRIPTADEAAGFAADSSPDKRSALIMRLVGGPEFSLHFGNSLDEWLQRGKAGDGEFLKYLRDSLAAGKSWDRLYREIMLGPWDTPDTRRAELFLSKRIQDLDELTNDTSRVFFGVDISCSKCHDHPLVDDWKQDHYYGMASFFNRTYQMKREAKGKRGGVDGIGERETGTVKFVDRKGTNREAKLMFLSGEMPAEPPENRDPRLKDRREAAEKEGTYLPPTYSRRERIVEIALNERGFFSRSAVNHVWALLLGRGLVHPVDQMHSQNPPSIPGVLELLAEDLVSGGYDLRRTAAAVAASKVYQRGSVWQGDSDPPAPEHFAVAALKPLTPKQYALSLTVLVQRSPVEQNPEARRKRYLELENRARELTVALDPRTDEFQSSAAEALFMSNNPAVRKLLAPAEGNLCSRLAAIQDVSQLVEQAVLAVHGRPIDEQEKQVLSEWITGQPGNRADVCAELLWSLVASAEFRFNY